MKNSVVEVEMSLKQMLQGFIQDEAGAAAIEYGLVAAIVSLGIMATVQQLPTVLNNIFSSVVTLLSN